MYSIPKGEWNQGSAISTKWEWLALDDLLEQKDGRSLYDDILLINELACQIAECVGTARASKALRSIDNRVQRITHEICKRIEREANINTDDCVYTPDETL
jgi:hypothetical protein